MGPFLWAWHPISTAALVQCPPIAGNGLLVYFNRFMAPKAIYTETLCTISSWAMDPPGPTLEPPMQ